MTNTPESTPASLSALHAQAERLAELVARVEGDCVCPVCCGDDGEGACPARLALDAAEELRNALGRLAVAL